MRGSMADLPVAFEGMGAVLRETEWGEMNAAIESFPAGLDTAPLFKGLPDDRCQCPHWGYVARGRFTVHYPDRTESIAAGDAYHLEPGHTIAYEEDTDLIEFSPRGQYRATMQVASKNVAALMEG
jgi:hypothetical protein